ncbi:MAG: protease [Thermoprotei archaeon]|nr:MAG: protease [Thermoprotei archaeon]
MIKEFMLMTMLTLLLVGIAGLVGALMGVSPANAAMWGLLISIPTNIITYLLSDKIVLMMTRAKIVSEYEAPRLHRIVEIVARRAGIPKPKVAIVPSDVPNAFATGRGPSSAVVAVTRGALALFTDDELEAVIGHEISHIKHRDLFVATMAAVIASAVGWLAYMARWGAFVRAMGERDEESSGIALIALIAAILAPIFALMIQMAISREREYKADEGSAYITRKPLALISALEKIEREVRRRGGVAMDVNPSTSSLWIVNPFRGSTLMELFSTHPPTWKRIERLKRLARELGIYR